MEKAVISKTIKRCDKCPNIKTGNFYSTDGWDRMEDWFCMACDDKKIASGVEWHDKIPIPDWCPYGLSEEKQVKPELKKNAGEMVKLITVNEIEFTIKVKLNYRVEKKLNGNRWHQVTYSSKDGKLINKSLIVDSELVEKIKQIENIINVWANAQIVNNDQRLIDLGFE